MRNKSILIVKGSAREQGYTNRLCKDLAENLSGNDIKVFDTYSEHFDPCIGCNYCEKAGRCINRDLDDFYTSFENADLIIFSSPVYNGTFTAPFKALLDRLQVYYTGFYANGKTQQIKKRRQAAFISASGRDGEKSFQYMQGQLKCACTILNIELKNSFLCSFTDTEPAYDRVLTEILRSLCDE